MMLCVRPSTICRRSGLLVLLAGIGASAGSTGVLAQTVKPMKTQFLQKPKQEPSNGSVVSAPSKRNSGPGPEEIMVTATHKSTNIMRTPIAVNAISRSTLNDYEVRRLNDLAGMAAGVTIPNQTLANQGIFIRGVGTTIASSNPSVAVYIDDIYIPRPYGLGWYGSLPDISQIEILHGPQGTLYGQSSSAGALKINSIVPTDKTVRMLEGGVGTESSYDEQSYLAGSLVDNKVTGSLATAYEHRGGPDYNAYFHRAVGDIDNFQVRGTLNFTPTEDFDARITADYMRDRGEYRTTAPINYPNGGLRTTFSNIDPSQPYDGGGIGIHLNYRPNRFLTLRSITGIRGFYTTTPVDSDGLPVNLSGFIRHVDQRQYSQEFQSVVHLGKLDLVSGILLYRENLGTNRTSWSKEQFSYISSNNMSQNIGLYSQADYKITPKLTLSAGLRYGINNTSLKSHANGLNAAGTIISNLYSINDLSTTYYALLPHASVSYQWTRSLFTYASFGVGQTTGGYNQAAPTLAIASIPVNPEDVLSYELGTKAAFFHNRLDLSVALFYSDYRNYQATIANPVFNGVQQAGTVVTNAGRASIYGSEIELRARPVERLETSLSVSYLHTRFDTFENPTGAASTNYVGDALPYAPSFTIRGGSTYRIPLHNHATVKLVGAVRYESSSFSEITSTRDLTKFPDQTYIDASVFYITPSQHWTYSVTSTNLAGRNYRLPVAGGCEPSAGYCGYISNYPRQVMFRVKHDF